MRYVNVYKIISLNKLCIFNKRCKDSARFDNQFYFLFLKLLYFFFQIRKTESLVHNRSKINTKNKTDSISPCKTIHAFIEHTCTTNELIDSLCFNHQNTIYRLQQSDK